MSAAAIVNRILEKLRTGSVVFIDIDSESPNVIFEYGHKQYDVWWSDSKKALIVRHGSCGSISDDYTRWVEGVLNGLVRNDAGEMVPA